MKYRVVEALGSGDGRPEATILSEHLTAAAAFAEAARVVQQRVRAGTAAEAVDVRVVADGDQVVSRPDAH